MSPPVHLRFPGVMKPNPCPVPPERGCSGAIHGGVSSDGPGAPDSAALHRWCAWARGSLGGPHCKDLPALVAVAPGLAQQHGLRACSGRSFPDSSQTSWASLHQNPQEIRTHTEGQKPQDTMSLGPPAPKPDDSQNVAEVWTGALPRSSE